MDYRTMKFKYQYQRHKTSNCSDKNYKKKHKMMNDDSVSEYEIGPNKETRGLVSNS